MKTASLLLKDPNGNLWYYVSKDGDLHKVTVVDEEDGCYTNTNITWYLTEEEFNQCTKIEVEA